MSGIPDFQLFAFLQLSALAGKFVFRKVLNVFQEYFWIFHQVVMKYPLDNEANHSPLTSAAITKRGNWHLLNGVVVYSGLTKIVGDWTGDLLFVMFCHIGGKWIYGWRIRRRHQVWDTQNILFRFSPNISSSVTAKKSLNADAVSNGWHHPNYFYSPHKSSRWINYLENGDWSTDE